MIWVASIIYVWAGLGYGIMLIKLRPLLTTKSAVTDIQIGFGALFLWPAIVIVLMFYDSDKSVTDDST